MKKIIMTALVLCFGSAYAKDAKVVVNEIPFQLVYSSEDDSTLVRSYVGAPIVKGKLEYYDSAMYGSTFSFVVDKTELSKVPTIQSFHGDFKAEYIDFDSDLSTEEVKRKADFFGMSMKLIDSKFVREQECKVSAPAVMQLDNINYVAYMDSEAFLTGSYLRLVSHGKYEIVCDQFADM